MESVYDVTQFICDEYVRICGHAIDEMKLQKLLYYTQRDSIAITGTPMFEADFEGWKYGPVCKSVRHAYSQKGLGINNPNLSPTNAYIVKNLLAGLGSIDSWELSKISHDEYSWQKSCVGLAYDDADFTTIELSDIIEDDKKTRPYDYYWDMYFDEFNDEEDDLISLSLPPPNQEEIESALSGDINSHLNDIQEYIYSIIPVDDGFTNEELSRMKTASKSILVQILGSGD